MLLALHSSQKDLRIYAGMKNFSLISEEHFSPSRIMPDYHAPASWQDNKCMSRFSEKFTSTEPVMLNYLMVPRTLGREEQKQIKPHESGHCMNILRLLYWSINEGGHINIALNISMQLQNASEHNISKQTSKDLYSGEKNNSSFMPMCSFPCNFFPITVLCYCKEIGTQ